MENDSPNRIDPPSSARLRRSTLIAAATAAVLLVAVVLPAEYGVDPLRIGSVLGMTEMGEIKMQLAREAEAEAAATPVATLDPADAQRLAEIERRLDEIHALLAAGTVVPGAAAGAPDAAADSAAAEQAAEPEWRDEITITLTPGQGVEYKLVMTEGAEAEFEWTANGGLLNYDTHGNGSGNSISYVQGRGVPEDSGVLVAAFDGDHGWFFRNRTDTDVVLTLRTRGDYSEFKRTV
ncbi:MAG: hypothetical protein R3305_06700 [Gammaproteobacteria bacterium]|nr:hypothetical protein [Gammaproteobacteria bacterium]